MKGSNWYPKADTDLKSRAYALQRNRPLTLQATISLPSPADDPTDPYAHLLNSFQSLANLFRPFNDAVVATWNKTRESWPASHFHGLQKQLADILPSFLNYGDSQLEDLRLNSQWVKTMTWHLSMGNGNMTGNDETMMYQQYAANLTTSLLSETASLQGTDMASLVSLAGGITVNSKEANTC